MPSQKEPRSFKVLLRDGESDCAFDYRVVARRKGYERVRLEEVAEAPSAIPAAEAANFPEVTGKRLPEGDVVRENP